MFMMRFQPDGLLGSSSILATTFRRVTTRPFNAG
jgi:hypothetical protein